MKITLKAGENTRAILDEMKDYWGFETDEAFLAAVISDAHTLMRAEQNGGSLVITPEGGAPRPIPLNKFIKLKPRIVK